MSDLLNALSELQWSAESRIWNGDVYPSCPTCGGLHEDTPPELHTVGHTERCPIGAALARRPNPLWVRDDEGGYRLDLGAITCVVDFEDTEWWWSVSIGEEGLNGSTETRQQSQLDAEDALQRHLVGIFDLLGYTVIPVRRDAP